MAIVRRQSAKGKNTVPPDIGFAAPPLPGSLMLFLSFVGNLGPPAGWADLFGISVGGFYRVFHRIAQAGDPAIIPAPTNPNDRWIVSEWTGVSPLGPIAVATATGGPDTHPHVAIAPVHAGEILIVGTAHHTNTVDTNFAPDAGFSLVQEQDFLPANTVAHGMIDRIDLVNAGAYDPGVSTAPFVGTWGAAAVAWAAAGAAASTARHPRRFW
jgi:hypothetical protein